MPFNHIFFNTILEFFANLNWNNIVEQLIVAGLIGLLAFVFTKKYLGKLILANKLNQYGFTGVTLFEEIKDTGREDVRKLLRKADVVKIIFISGVNFLKVYSRDIKSALDRGAKIKMLLADPDDNPFLENIEALENRKKKDNIRDEIFQSIKNKRIEFKYYKTEYRLPLIIAYYPNNEIKGWISITLPPYNSRESFILNGSSKNSDVNSNFIFMMENHFDSIWEIAKDPKNNSIN